MKIARWPYRVPEPIDPDAVLDYRIDWSDWLSDGESISVSEWTVSGATKGITSFTDDSATVWISDATGTEIQLANRITTDSTPAGRKDERTLIIRVLSR